MSQSGNVSGSLLEGPYAMSIYRGANTSGDEDTIGTMWVRPIPERSDPTETATGDAGATASESVSDDDGSSTDANPGSPVKNPAVIGGGALGLVAIVGVGLRAFRQY